MELKVKAVNFDGKTYLQLYVELEVNGSKRDIVLTAKSKLEKDLLVDAVQGQ